MFTGVNLGCMVEMEPTRAKFKRWGQHGIPELARVTLGRGLVTFRSEICRHTSKMNNKRYLLTQ